MIPDDWAFLSLGEVVDFLDNRRIPLNDADRQKRQGPYPYYGASGVIDYINDFLFDDDLILLGEDGANILNRSTPLAFRVSGKIWVNNHAHVLKPKIGCDLDYLVEYLESLNYGPYNTGTAQPKLNREVCEKIPVRVPPSAEQKRIGVIARAWDRAIELTEKLIAAKQRRKAALMQQLLTGKVRLPGFTGEWQITKLGQFLCESRLPGSTGKLARKITVKLFGRGVAAKQETRPGSEGTKYYRRRAGQFIYSKLDFLNGAFGIVPEELDGYESTLDVPAFDVADEVDRRWLLLFVSREGFYKTGLSLANGGRKARRVNPSDFLRTGIPLPEHQEQSAIADVLTAAEQEIALHARKLDALRRQKKGLMQQLLTGKVRVCVDESKTHRSENLGESFSPTSLEVLGGGAILA
jgi:type I restriction enzyme S subunit